MNDSQSDLSGKIALVTGASRGIGRATAIELARRGANVVVNFVSNESAAREVVSAIQSCGRRAMLVKADVSEEEDVQSMIEAIGREMGHLDILVSNVAGGGFRPIDKSTKKHFDNAMHINVLPLLYLFQHSKSLFRCTPHSRGKVIALSSHGADRALPHYGLIGASKAALESLVRHMALEYGGLYINFNSVLAGLVATDSTSGFDRAEELHQYANDSMTVGEGVRLTVSDVANCVAFLASSASDLVQGHTLVVDGGAGLRI